MENLYIDAYNRVWGNKPINGDITITKDVNDTLVVQVSDKTYTLVLPPITYKTEYTTSYSELIDALNKQATDNLIPLNIFLGGYHKDTKYNVVVIQKKDGQEIIEITGSFFDQYM